MRGKPWGEKESDPVRPHFDAQNPPVYEDVESLRWKVLVDNTGERVGTIENVEADEDTGRVEFIQIGRGGFLGF
ncbi:MAG: PRC-barrel domain-containing protein, partial [Thermomicrobiales bacterium]|nr:PRC-barrel domain-containing protein [Thermomicrobiales bacterium]